jgi:hypothetical protein
MPLLPTSLRSFGVAMRSHLLWDYCRSLKGTAWEVLWGAGFIGVVFTIYTLYRSPSWTVLLLYFLLVEFLAGYFVWRADRVRLSNKEDLARLHERFRVYMTEGEELTREHRRGIREHGYGPWLEKRRQLVERVSEAITGLGLPDEAAAFRHAGEADPDVSQLVGPNQSLYWFRFYNGQLDRWREKLADIVARRLVFARPRIFNLT